MQVEVTLVRAPEDGSARDAGYQAELRSVERSLFLKGVKASSIVQVRESAGGGAVHLGQFALEIVQTAGSVVAVILGAWLQARFGRRIKMKVGDIEVEARTTEEVQALLERAQRLQDKEPRIIP